jgi:nucleotide-binding universal stress UspA family protein
MVAKPKIMVALRGGEALESLVSLACQLSVGMDAELIALHVVEIPPATPIEADEEVLDRSGKELLARARRVARGFSKELGTRLVRARGVGEAIVGEAREQGVELLVMGHHKPHPHPLGEILLGSTVQYVAHHTPCRVIVQIPPPEHR